MTRRKKNDEERKEGLLQCLNKKWTGLEDKSGKNNKSPTRGGKVRQNKLLKKTVSRHQRGEKHRNGLIKQAKRKYKGKTVHARR